MAKEVLLSDPPMGGDGGGGPLSSGPASAPPPPPQGLGNFKGVMLCNRPAEPGQPGSGADRGEDGQPPPFRSRVSETHGERLGLNPCAKAVAAPSKKYRNESLRKHGCWLEDLQRGIAREQLRKQDDTFGKVEKEVNIKRSSAKYRSGVRMMLQERDEEHEAELQAAKEANRIARGLAPPPGPPGGGTGGAEKKPFWAMTKSEVADFDRAEAEELIDFAEGLDYDQYINDLEIREALCVMKDRVGKLKREQEDFKRRLVEEFNTAEPDEADMFDEELGESASQVGGGSQVGSEASAARRAGQRRAGAGAGAVAGGSEPGSRPDWDASSNLGEAAAQDSQKAELAKEILASNSQMRAVHSKGSVQKMLEKHKAETGDADADAASR